MNAKYWFLVAVVAGLLGWAGIETQRLCVARKQLAASRALQNSVSQRLALAHLSQSQSLVKEK